MADLQTLWALMTGVATAPPFKLPTLDPATAFQMITSERVGGLACSVPHEWIADLTHVPRVHLHACKLNGSAQHIQTG